MHRKHLLILVSFALFLSIPLTVRSQESVVGLDLGPAVQKAPAIETDWHAGVNVDRFLPANGVNAPVTPTLVSLLWDSSALYVRFRCSDPDPVYRHGIRVRRSDQVEVGYVAPGGKQQDLWQFDAEESGRAVARHGGQSTELSTAKVVVDAEAWSAELAIPWTTIGRLPSQVFLLQLSRTRGITGEVLSPASADFHDGPADTWRAPAAIDQFIEVKLGGTKGIKTAAAGLITLPSGTRRWERRALLHHIGVDERKELAGLQKELPVKPTAAANLADRVRLAELWYDLLDQEGMSFHYEGGAWTLGPGELDPWTARHKFNDALKGGDLTEACRIIDSLLRHFSRASELWFADGTPGDVDDATWTPLASIRSAELANQQVVIHALAGQKDIDFYLSFPSTGGVRLHGPATGFFAPATETAIQLDQTKNGARATANDLTVDIAFGSSWHIALHPAKDSRLLWSLGQGDLSVLEENGQIRGVDVRGNLNPADEIVGLGERFDSLDQRGKTLTLWQTDAWDSTALGGLSNQAYKPIPFWLNTAGYGVFWNTSYEIRADFGSDRADRYRVTAHGPIFDLYIWPGEGGEVARQYSALTGRPLLPPAWAFEPWMGGGGDRWAEEKWESPTQTMLDVVDRFHRLDIPHSAIYAEGDASSDPLLYRRLMPMNIHILTWARNEALGWGMDRIKAAVPDLPTEKLPLMRVPDGTAFSFYPPYQPGDQFPYIDFTDPRGLDLYRAFWKERQDLGVSGSMADFSDLVPRNAVFHDGSTGEQMHNWYVHSYDHAIHQVFQERHGDDFILFARAAAPGTQVDAGQMAGDHASNFRGFDESIAGGLSLCTSGFSNWGSDVGGYLGKGDEEVYLRWVEFGTFSPLMRFHGTEPREPWYYSDAAVDTYKKFAWVRENLLPYIYGSAQDAHAFGIPLMRSMPTVAADEYMFGDDLLVAPVHAPGDHRSVTLPQGHWVDLWSGAPIEAGTSDRSVSIDDIPVFLRAGALLPVELAPNFALGESMSSGRVSALIVTPPDQGRSSHDWKLPGGSDVVHLASVPDGNSFAVTAENWYQLQYVFVSGLRSAIKSVTVDGEVLPEFDAQSAESLPPGWEKLGANNFLIRLPMGLKHAIRISEAGTNRP
jgi:alpha-glucosidase (family GH31 glycosyl hydrolase)